MREKPPMYRDLVLWRYWVTVHRKFSVRVKVLHFSGTITRSIVWPSPSLTVSELKDLIFGGRQLYLSETCRNDPSNISTNLYRRLGPSLRSELWEVNGKPPLIHTWRISNGTRRLGMVGVVDTSPRPPRIKGKRRGETGVGYGVAASLTKTTVWVTSERLRE